MPAALPAWVVRPLDEAAADLVSGEGVPDFDFSTPAGKPALVAADSVSWRIFKNPIALFVGGVAAVLLELGEPRVRIGVWEHTSFRDEPKLRLQRTGLAAMATVYGPATAATAMIEGISKRHAAISAIDPSGAPFRANDPDLLDWVQATASFGFIEAYHAYASRLSDADKDACYREALPAARLYGAEGAPTSVAAQVALFEAMRPRLEPSPVIREFLAIMRLNPILPGPLRLFQGMLIRAAVEILPDWAVERLELRAWRLQGWERMLVKAMGRLSDRIPLPSAPPAKACVRLGLPADYLYRR